MSCIRFIVILVQLLWELAHKMRGDVHIHLYTLILTVYFAVVQVERRYRDKLQGELSALRDAVPATHSSKRLDKAAVMRKAVDYIKFLEKENGVHG